MYDTNPGLDTGHLIDQTYNMLAIGHLIAARSHEAHWDPHKAAAFERSFLYSRFSMAYTSALNAQPSHIKSSSPIFDWRSV